ARGATAAYLNQTLRQVAAHKAPRSRPQTLFSRPIHRSCFTRMTRIKSGFLSVSSVVENPVRNIGLCLVVLIRLPDIEPVFTNRERDDCSSFLQQQLNQIRNVVRLTI